MRAGKDQDSLMEGGLFSLGFKKKSKKEELIDKKIEHLLETYKKQDEELIRKASDKGSRKK
jgi:hypothetical protein